MAKAIVLACWMAAVVPSSCELIKLVELSRHGTRAPKPKYFLKASCPDDPWEWKWPVADSQLTAQGSGGAQAASVGRMMKKHYGSWLGPYNGSLHYYRAGYAHRNRQTAMIASENTFDIRYIPIDTVRSPDDDLLKPDDGVCEWRAEQDKDEYLAAGGSETFASEEPLYKVVGEFCGKIATSGSELKRQIDQMMMSKREGYLTDEISASDLYSAQKAAVREQIDIATWKDDSITYMAGAFPQYLVSTFEAAVEQYKNPPHIPWVNSKTPNHYKFEGYFSSRQGLMSLSAFLGWTIQCEGSPPGQTVPGLTLVFELSVDGADVTVAIKSWDPNCPDTTNGVASEDCPLMPVYLPGCGDDNVCSLDEFKAIVDKRIARTGYLYDICLKEPAPSPLPIDKCCPEGCALASSTEGFRRALLFGSASPVCPLGCVPMAPASRSLHAIQDKAGSKPIKDEYYQRVGWLADQ